MPARRALPDLRRVLGDRARAVRWVLGNRARTVRWLLGARAAQATLAVLSAVALFAWPPLLDRVLPELYPDVTVQKKVLGFLPRSQQVADPRIPERRSQLIALAWIGVAGATLAVLLRRLPASGTTGATDTVVGPSGRHATGPVLARTGLDGRYSLAREIARGGMGVVYLARDRVLERDVAIKELTAGNGPAPELVDRFRREAQALARLTHPNIVQVYDLLEDEGHLWIVMELVEGESVAAALAARGPVPAEDAARIGMQVAQGLAFAHGKGVIHRDVKPSNILMTRDGTPKLADFGVARVLGSGTGTQAGQVLGSPHYMSPEQASGREADERSDVYSMGVTLYEMIAGERPFEGDLASVLAQHLTRPAPPLPGLTDPAGRELETVILRMLDKDPARRPAGMEETARLLRPFCPAAGAPGVIV